MKSPITAKRVVSGLLLLSYCCSPFALRAETGSATAQGQEPKRGFYSQLLPYFINTQQANLAAQQQPSIATGAPAAKKTAVVDVTLHELNANEQARMTLEILDHYVPKQAVVTSQVMPLEKFNIKIAGKRDVVSKLMPRGTVWGQVAFAADCAQAFDYDQLTQRQTITKSFVDKDELRNRAQRAFELIKSGQRAYLSYFEQVDETTKKVLDSVYFGGPVLSWLNTNKPALAVSEAGRWVQLALLPAIWSGLAATILGSTGSAAGKILEGYAGKDLSLWQKLKVAGSELSVVPGNVVKTFGKKVFYSHKLTADAEWTKKIDDRASQIRSNWFAMQSIYEQIYGIFPEDLKNQMIGQLTDSDKDVVARLGARIQLQLNGEKPEWSSLRDDYISSKEAFFTLKKFAPAVAGALTYGQRAILDTLLFFALKKAAAEIAQTNSIYNNYQTRLIGMAKIVRGLTMLADVARESNNEQMQAVAQDIELFLDASTKKDLSALLDALETGTFATETGFLSNRPRILAAQKLMEQCREYFVRPLAAAGRLETFVAAADYYARHQGTGKPVCFVEFVNDAQPRLELNNCWNILIDEQKAVVISAINFGKNGAQNAILNGPNGTGKSTNENAIALAYFLGKFGINCGSGALMTPFEGFEVHRNEQEDIEKGDSSFMAQKARFDEICSRIASLSNKRMIIFMDEPLNGTVEQEAGRIIYEKCSALLANQTQAICIIATHAQQPTQLEADTHGAFVNYYVEVLEPEVGQFVRTYRLLPGLADWWFNDADKRHRFVNWLSQKRDPTVKTVED